MSDSSSSKMAAALPTRPFSAKFEEITPEDAKERSRLTNQIYLAKVTIKPKRCSDSEFFEKLTKITREELERTRLNKKQSGYNFFKSRGECDEDAVWDDWINSDEARKLDERERNLDLAARLYQAQADTRKSQKDHSKATRRRFLQMWPTMRHGFGATPAEAAPGSRSDRAQQGFRTALEKACNSHHPDWPRRGMQWCPVLGGWFYESNEHTAYIFPHRFGQAMMTSIFGFDHEKPALMGIQNGLILSAMAKDYINENKIVIVPDIDDDASEEAIDNWTRSEPKGYKTRIVNLTPRQLDKYLPCHEDENRSLSQRTWRQLEDAPLQFRSDHRPRARYLYWRYCPTILRNSWRKPNHQRNNALLPEFRKPFWGARSAYMKKSMLMAFVEEMGHEYDDLLKGAAEDINDTVKPDTTALMAANEAIAWTFQDDEENDEDLYNDA